MLILEFVNWRNQLVEPAVMTIRKNPWELLEDTGKGGTGRGIMNP
jgi:hypothetical protein